MVHRTKIIPPNKSLSKAVALTNCYNETMDQDIRKLIVTHHAPDLDAITSVWLLKRFDGQKYATAKVAFVNPGDRITEDEARHLYKCQLSEVTHVDTGLGKFDHHQSNKATPDICASSLVLDYLHQVHPELKDDLALSEMIKHVLVVDHFGEINWPEAKENRYVFTLHELIRGHEFTDLHNDDSQLHFGMEALSYAYAAMNQRLKAEEIIQSKGQEFILPEGKCLALETRNDDTLKQAQLKGYILVLRKDPEFGHIRIKVRPDSKLILDKLYQEIKKLDPKSTWFYHGSGKMLLNGSIKHRNQIPSQMSLSQMVKLIKQVYA